MLNKNTTVDNFIVFLQLRYHIIDPSYWMFGGKSLFENMFDLTDELILLCYISFADTPSNILHSDFWCFFELPFDKWWKNKVRFWRLPHVDIVFQNTKCSCVLHTNWYINGIFKLYLYWKIENVNDDDHQRCFGKL